MNISEIAQLSGYSRQRINQLVTMGYAPGIERKPNGRLLVTDEGRVRKWCDRLRLRKDDRHQRNKRRTEKRDRLKIRRRIMNKDPAPFMREMYRDVVSSVRGAFPDAPTGNSLWDQYVSDTVRKTILDVTKADEIQTTAFLLRGRWAETSYARRMLYDFATNPAAIPWIKSYSDIAREAGCTRAAVSAMAKQLPEGIHGRSGRLKSSPSPPGSSRPSFRRSEPYPLP